MMDIRSQDAPHPNDGEHRHADRGRTCNETQRLSLYKGARDTAMLA